MITPTSGPSKLYQLMLRRMSSKVQDEEMKNELQESSRRDNIDVYDLADLFDLIDEKGLHVTLLMDEFENIGRNENFEPDFYYGLRSLAIHHNLALITGSRIDLVELSHLDQVRSSPFFNIFSTIHLQPFTPEDVHSFVETYLSDTEVTFT